MSPYESRSNGRVHVLNHVRTESPRPTQKSIDDIFETSGGFFGRGRPSEIRYRQTHFGQNMETDGQSGETVPTPTYELEELAPFHPGHSARHLPKTASDLLQVRGQHVRAVQH